MSRPDVPRYSRISTRFWIDERSACWSDNIKLSSLYFMTCAHRTLEGIFLLPLPYASADLRWTPKKVSKAIAFLTEESFLRFDSKTNTMLIRNALRYQAPENENQAKSCLRRIANLPKTDLLLEFLLLAKQHCYRKGASPYAQTFYQLLEQQLTQQLGELLRSLNLQSSPLPQPLTKPNTSHLQPRLNGVEGAGEDFCLSQHSEEERKETEIRKKWPNLAEVG